MIPTILPQQGVHQLTVGCLSALVGIQVATFQFIVGLNQGQEFAQVEAQPPSQLDAAAYIVDQAVHLTPGLRHIQPELVIAGEPSIDQLTNDLSLVPEVVIEVARADLHFSGDVVGGNRAGPLLIEECEGGVEDAVSCRFLRVCRRTVVHCRCPERFCGYPVAQYHSIAKVITLEM